MSTWKTHFASLCLALSLVLMLLTFAVSPAYAWTHAENSWDTGGTAYCGTASNSPCVYWAQPSNTSIKLYVYFDASLKSAPGNYDFTVAINRAFSDWNSQSAWNPYMNGCYVSRCENAGEYIMGNLGYAIYGATDFGTLGTSKWNSTNSFWYAPFQYETVYFNTQITWNNSLSFSDTTADGRKVSTHETGHFLGLGHTAHTPAIMHQGAANYYSVQSDDLTGLQNVYPGYYPGSTQ